MEVLLRLTDEIGADVVENNLAAMPVGRREVQLLIAADDVDAAKQTAIDLCTKAFSTTPAPGVVTFVSRGTDDDARGVLSAFGLTGEIARAPGDDGFDIVSGNEQLDLTSADRHSREIVFDDVGTDLVSEPQEHLHALS